ncbi:MAG: ankyrin repeat domain-containing protein [Rickettsiales bacterium]|jgi:ankyrin repeat protein|nr:ankyrin repeat domain-containing protein [Rickettsiales bacterium]
MDKDTSALTTNANKLGECIDKNEKREQDKKDEQLYDTIKKKVKKEKHERGKPRSKDGALKECERLFKEGANSNVLEHFAEELENLTPEKEDCYKKYYFECFLPTLNEKIKRSKKIPNEIKDQVKQVIFKITCNNKDCFNSTTHSQNDRRNSKDSGVESDIEGDYEYSTNDIEPLIPKSKSKNPEVINKTSNDIHTALKAVKKGKRKFEKWLKGSTDICNVKDEKGNNVLHLIALLKKKQKRRSLNVLIEKISKEDLVQLIDREDQDGKTPLQVALIDKITKEKHESNTIQDNDNTLKFLIKLLEHGAKPDQLELSTKELQDLNEEQETYYRNFLKKLAEPGKKPKLEPEIKINTEAKIKEIIVRTINTPNSNSNYPLHLVIKNGNKKLFEELLQKGADVSLKDANGNHALHLIVTLEKKQKLEFLNISLEVGQKEQFIKAVNDKNNNDQTPLQKLLFSKVKKEEHSSGSISGKIVKFLKRPFTEYDDSTIESAIQLFKLGANHDDLQLSKEELQSLDKQQKTYYDNFLEKLAGSVKKSKLDKNTRDPVVIKIAEIIYDDYPLHKAVLRKDQNKFRELLKSDYDITTKDAEGNTVLYYAVTLDEQAKYDFTKLILEKNKELVNTSNDQQTPLHRLFQYIEEKSKNQSRTGRKFEGTKRYETLELLLRNGADITAQDKEQKNALHHIALFKGEQKVVCLGLIVDLVKEGKIPAGKLSEAVDAKNDKKQTPLQVALIAKMVKDTHNLINPNSRDNTIKFCVKLLRNGVDQKQLVLREELWNREYYKTLKGTKEMIGRPVIPDDMETELKYRFGKKFKVRDTMKYINNGACKVVTTLVFAALACAVIFGVSQGSITTAIASSIIAAIGVCYLIYLNLDNIYEGFKKIKGKFTEEKQITPQGNASKNDIQYNNSVQNTENKLNNSEKREIQKPSDQPEHIESPPNTEMNAISIISSLKNCVGIV